MKCFLDDNEAIDSIEVDAGNNAEIGVTLNLCEAHLKEAEETGYKFQQKNAARIEELAYQKWGC